MPNPWLSLSFNMWRLGLEAQTVMALRMMRLAAGGAAAQREAARMVSEKRAAAVQAGLTAATLGAVGKKHPAIGRKVVSGYRKRSGRTDAGSPDRRRGTPRDLGRPRRMWAMPNSGCRSAAAAFYPADNKKPHRRIAHGQPPPRRRAAPRQQSAVQRPQAQARHVLQQPLRRLHDVRHRRHPDGDLAKHRGARAHGRRDGIRGDRAGRPLEGLRRRDRLQRPGL